MATFYETITAAVADIQEYGYDSDERVDYWMQQIQAAAEADMVSPEELQEQLQRVLRGAYDRLVEQGSILKRHRGVPRFTLRNIKPKLRPELDRRLLASASLIRLNRDQTIADTLRRFQGWATSIPVGGEKGGRQEAKNHIGKELRSLPFRERRVLIDQGHKLVAAISDIIAMDQDAIAAKWHSNWRQLNYDYREEHKERDGVVYPVKGNWALTDGLMRRGEDGYYEDHERPGELPYCRCYVSWIYNLRDLPKPLLTKAGETALAEAKVAG